MKFKKAISSEILLQTGKSEYNLNTNENKILEGRMINNIIIRNKDGDGFRKTAIGHDLVSDETLSAGHLTIIDNNSTEIIKDFPLEMLVYQKDGDMPFDISISDINLSSSKLVFRNISSDDNKKAIEFIFLYS